MEEAKITIIPERIRRFVLEGGLVGNAVDHFLNSTCYALELINIHPQVVKETFDDILDAGLVVGFERTQEDKINLKVWLPSDHSKKVTDKIKVTYKNLGMEPPYEFYNFEDLDRTLSGKELIQRSLISALKKGIPV